MKKNRLVILISLLAFLMLLAYGRVDASPKEDNKYVVVEVKPHVKSIEGKNFGAQLWLVDDLELPQRWWSIPDRVYEIPRVNKIQRGKPIMPVIIFAGAGEKEGLCDLTWDIIVRKPDGTIYGEAKDLNCWKGMSVPPPNELQMSIESLATVIEKTDPSGKYTVEAVVHDNIKELELVLHQYFEVE